MLDLVIYLHHTHLVEWYVIRCNFKYGDYKDMCIHKVSDYMFKIL